MTQEFKNLAAEIIRHATSEYKKKYSHEFKLAVICEMTEQLLALKECYEKLINTRMSMFQFVNEMQIPEDEEIKEYQD